MLFNNTTIDKLSKDLSMFRRGMSQYMIKNHICNIENPYNLHNNYNHCSAIFKQNKKQCI